jgi:cellobiose phosphorylase
VFGFAGVRPRADALAIDPHIPEIWPHLEIRVQFRGVPARLQLEPHFVVVNVPAPITVVVDGRRVTCAAGPTRIPTG